jgi:hypothetical protein
MKKKHMLVDFADVIRIKMNEGYSKLGKIISWMTNFCIINLCCRLPLGMTIVARPLKHVSKKKHVCIMHHDEKL